MVFETLLPLSKGYLPSWLFFISTLSVFNSVQTYFSMDLSKKVYSNSKDITPLSVRTFGTWTFITSIVRLYGSWYTTTQPVYDLCLWSFIVASGHFNLEWLVYKNCKFDKGLMGPFIVSTVSIIWMISQRDFYLN
ncbi:ergosterol biosynthetic protein 28 [[Candida] jaroonii]|uniref:Ergosterol biosynthetic protein 28 n=1 Tax=[Candida] jaroonii TaxID=467808 RepID=A0ACA9Y4C2_9ASCO|nr:ergosterol biosynthetic protein 28 [[Candida] jaroonii]